MVKAKTSPSVGTPTPSQRARRTDKWTEILFRALTARVAKRWKLVSFRGKKGAEWRGIVDVIAIRKNTEASAHEVLKSGDLFDIVLVQLKGGSARKPTSDDILRLLAVKQRYAAKSVVLFSWKHGKSCEFYVLDDEGQWKATDSKEIFG